ncbi:MAG: YrdB family protein [Spirochaetaceae bacterium]|nr:MAG: YrdB family protein [Spirochaetaceae bacterium]
MGTHPVNLVLRFMLELAALFSLGYWGWSEHTGPLRFILVVAVPLAAAGIWGIFSTPGDRSRSSKSIVPTPGILRLVLELLLFGAAIWALYTADRRIVALIYAGIIVLHYGLSYDRIVWLVKN